MPVAMIAQFDACRRSTPTKSVALGRVNSFEPRSATASPVNASLRACGTIGARKVRIRTSDMTTNRQIILDKRPRTEATADDFKLVVGETPPLREGQVLVRHHYLSLIPTCAGA